MTYIKRLLPVSLVLLLVVSAGCQGRKLPAVWADIPPIIDGQSVDWSGEKIFDIESLTTHVELKNDSHAVYCLMKFDDPRWLHRAVSEGVTLWLDGAGGKNKDYGIKLSLPVGFHPEREQPSDFPAIADRKMLREPPNQRIPPLDSLLAKLKTTVVFGPDDPGISIDTKSTKPPQFRINADNSALICEFSVPLLGKSGRGFGITADAGDVISLSFDFKEDLPIGFGKSKGPDKGDKRGGRPEGGFPPNGGGGGMPPGGGSGGMGGTPPGGQRGMPPGEGNRPEMSGSAEAVWIKIQLASSR